MGAMATLPSIKHVRPVQPLHFPSSDPEWHMPESTRHSDLCSLLQQVLKHGLCPEHSVGKDNFVYFDANAPTRCLAPDAFVKLGVRHEAFSSWKTWQRGTPELCVEILSPSDTEEKSLLKDKLEDYRSLGAREIVVFDADEPEGKRLRAWDRIEEDLVERVVENETTPCLTLRAHWVLAPAKDLETALRIAHDVAGTQLWLTDAEDERRQKEDALRREQEAIREVERLRALLAKR
jgi:Uma2 family endonuclease